MSNTAPSPDHISVDCCIIGAGPAGLAAALAFSKEVKKRNKIKTVLVIDKAPLPSAHTLSGAVMSRAAMKHLEQIIENPEYFKQIQSIARPVQHDWMHFLAPYTGIRVPGKILPPNLQHHNDMIVQAGKLTDILHSACEAAGIHIYNGVSVSDFIMKNGIVEALIIPEAGRDKNRRKKSSFKSAEIIKAETFIFAEGTLGTLSEKLISQCSLANPVQPQLYSIGVKQLIRLSPKSTLRPDTAIHSLGYPLPVTVFGGGFLYALENNMAAVGLLIGLDYKIKNLNPVHELERFKSHPHIARLIDGHKVVLCGAKTTPEGGYYSLPVPGYGNVLIAGDAGGFMNLFMFKGLHLAIASGIAAGKSSAHHQEQQLVLNYMHTLSKMGVSRELYKGRNFRQIFRSPLGFLAGAPLSLLQHLIPFPLSLHKDRDSPLTRTQKNNYHGMNREEFVFHSGTRHEEDSLSHIVITDSALCRTCIQLKKNTCLHFCPGKVYSLNNDGTIQIQHVNCLHDKTCLVKCPYDNIEWTPPGDGGGPRYAGM
ncbi:MAG: 4Fe-4S dicluster domain-containing protein [Spirochaetales bacterium]|nr:4Fe-4S dicluster domain-containing protein [Spirochaetales bacterium]